MLKEDIDSKYINHAQQLEAEFFDIADEGRPSQHRLLKKGKIIEEFDLRHGKIWQNHEAELLAEGFMEAPTPPEPIRDLEAEMDELKARVTKLELPLP